MRYAHTKVAVADSRSFRSALLAAVAADHAIDVEIGSDTQDPACVRHTVEINGRVIGYEGFVGASGKAGLRYFECLDRSCLASAHKVKRLRGIDELRDMASLRAILGKNVSW